MTPGRILTTVRPSLNKKYTNSNSSCFVEYYQKLTNLKRSGVKVSIAIGGWNDSQGDKYSRLVNNPVARGKFINHVVSFIEKYNFDGLDLDWEYPACWQTECKKERYKDKPAFATFVAELRYESFPT